MLKFHRLRGCLFIWCWGNSILDPKSNDMARETEKCARFLLHLLEKFVRRWKKANIPLSGVKTMAKGKQVIFPNIVFRQHHKKAA